MQVRNQFTISSMMAKQLIEKYNAQNAKYPVEYMELVLDEESGMELIGPRTLDLIESGNPYRGLWIRKHSVDELNFPEIIEGDSAKESVVMVQFVKLIRMHKDFCRIEVVYDDDPHYVARFTEYRRD